MKHTQGLKAECAGKRMLSAFICAYINIQSKQKNSPLKNQTVILEVRLKMKEARISNRTPRFFAYVSFGSPL